MDIPVALPHLLIHLILLAVSLISLSLLLGLLFDMQDPVTKPLTTGTRQRLRQHPFPLLPIIRLRSLQDVKKRIHFRWKWQRPVASFMPTTSPKFEHPQADNSHPELRRLMVTEVDRYGVHRNRQPEFFFNGIIGHIRADQNGWIDSWEQATQLANYWRRHFQIPEVHPDGNWYQYPQESNSANQAGESQESLPGSDMEDTDSLIVYMQHPHRHRVRSTSWPPFFGTFSTMTEGPTWPFSRNWRTQQTIRSRSFRQQTWLTLLATWHRPLATCRIKLNKWRRSPTSAIESDYSGLKVF